MTEPANSTRYFYMKAIKNEAKSKEAGRPIFEDRLYFKDLMPGDRNMEIDRPIKEDELNEIKNYVPDREDSKDKVAYMRMLQQLLHRFEQGQSQEQQGYPLKQWPQVTASQVKEMEFAGIFTVEQLAELPDDAAQNLGRGYFTLKQAAKEFFETADKTAKINEQDEKISKQDDEIAKLKAELAALAGAKRGRKPKQETEAA